MVVKVSGVFVNGHGRNPLEIDVLSEKKNTFRIK